jgi:hypothetical protein
MNATNHRARSFSPSLLAILFFVGGGLVACTTQEAKSDGGGGKGGSSATGNGGSNATGNGGTTGTGGAGGSMYATSDGTACLPPATSGLIIDFSPAAPGDGGVTADAGAATDGGAAAPAQARFGDDSTTLSGGTYFYPNDPTMSMYALKSDFSASNWHLTGTVGDYSGFGLYLDNCSRIDASTFGGLSFTISGTVQGGMLTVEIDTLSDTIAASWLIAHPASGSSPKDGDPGRCIPNATATNQYNQSDCTEPTKVITVGSSPAPVTVHWTDFTTGKPQAAVTPTDIIAIRFILPTPAGVGTASVTTYPLDLVVDDLKFVP